MSYLEFAHWALVGRPVIVREFTPGEVWVFVQKSHMRGRPWLRFQKKIDADGWWVTGHKTRKEAVNY